MRTAEFRKATRRERWMKLSQIGGVYVPELYTLDEDYSNRLTPVEAVPNRVRAGVVTSLKPEYYPERPIVPFVRGVHDRLTVEIMRGCTQGCRFCQAGMLHRPVRERPVADIVDQVMTSIDNTGWDEIGLLSLSTSDYSQLEDLLALLVDQLSGRRVSMAFPSLRPATFTEEMARIDLGGRKSGVTFAVEAGSQRLRDVINKSLVEEELIEAVERAYRLGWKTVKLYFMVGLPTERMDDIEEGARLLEKLAGMTPRRKELHISVSPFIPKPHSVFGREEFLNTDELSNRIRRLYSRVPSRFVKTSWHDPEVSLIEALLARGDRRMSAVVESVATNSNGLDSWSEMMDLSLWHEALREHIPGWSNLLKAIPQEHKLAWGHLSKGYSNRFYPDDLDRSRQARLLADCRSGECYNCGLTKLCDKVAEDTIAVGSGGAEMVAMSPKPILVLSEVLQRSETRLRYRLMFTKLLNVRYIGHKDLMSAVLRALRRAGTPLIYGQGYSHRPRVSYAPALPLGVGADRLWIEFETPVKLDADEWLQRWRSVFPSGIRPLTLDQVPKEYKSGTAQLQKRAYRLRFNRRVKISSDTAVQSLCSDLDIDIWNLNRKGRTLTLQLNRQSGETLNPVETGLKLVVAEPETASNSIGVISVTQLTETRFASKSGHTADRLQEVIPLKADTL